MPRQRQTDHETYAYDQFIWTQSAREKVAYDFSSRNWKYQKFSKIDACVIASGLKCTGPVAMCCSVLLEYLNECMKNTTSFDHSASQFQKRALPCCTIRQVKQYLKKMVDCGFLGRSFSMNKVSTWTINYQKIVDIRIKLLKKTGGYHE